LGQEFGCGWWASCATCVLVPRLASAMDQAMMVLSAPHE
jgi:hypothetical protein